MSTRLRQLALLGAALLSASCGNAVLGIQLNLVTRNCPGVDPARDPALAVSQLRITVSGDNLQPIPVTAAFTAGKASVPNVPVGTNRRVVVEALHGGLVRARADSGPFDATGSSDVNLTLFLRVIDAFTPVSDATANTCTQMSVPRAGHAMALLPDGRVLITGGFSIGDTGLIVPHGEAEIFDPATGQFTSVPASQFRRSGHTAVPVAVGPDGSGVLVLGGEGLDGTSSEGGPIKALELFSSGLWKTIQPAATSPAREHQAAAVDARTGYVLMAGGQSAPDARGPSVFDTAAYYNPQTGAVTDVGTHLSIGPITDAVAVARQNKARNGPVQGGIVLVGGRNGTLQPSKQISGLIWHDTTNDFANDAAFTPTEVSSLPTPRVKHVAVQLADDTVLTAGGLTALPNGPDDYSTPTDAVTVIDAAGGYVADVSGAKLVQARADSCATVLEDGSVLVTGGAWKDGNGLHSGRETDLIVPQGRNTTVRSLQGPTQGGDWVLTQGRYRASCLRLRNGSVLITGGLQVQADGTLRALGSAEIYTPVGVAVQ
jgi:hypothetical protein